jgi:hypothetical protein
MLVARLIGGIAERGPSHSSQGKEFQVATGRAVMDWLGKVYMYVARSQHAPCRSARFALAEQETDFLQGLGKGVFARHLHGFAGGVV